MKRYINMKKILLSLSIMCNFLCYATDSNLYTKITNEREFCMLAHRICWSSWCSYLEQNPQNKNNVFFTNKNLRESMYREIGKAIATIMTESNNTMYTFINGVQVVQFTDNDKIDSYNQANWNAVMLYSYIATYCHNKQLPKMDNVADIIKQHYGKYTKDKYINSKIDKAKDDIKKYISTSMFKNYSPHFLYGYMSYTAEANLAPATLLFNKDTKTGSFFIPNVIFKDQTGATKKSHMLVSVTNGNIEYITPQKTYGSMNVYCEVKDCVSKPLQKIEAVTPKRILYQVIPSANKNDSKQVETTNMCYMTSTLNCLNMSTQFRTAINQVANKPTKEVTLRNGEKYKLNLCKVVNKLLQLTTEDAKLSNKEYLYKMAQLHKEFNEASIETMKCLRLKTTYDTIYNCCINDDKFQKEVVINDDTMGSALGAVIQGAYFSNDNKDYDIGKVTELYKKFLNQWKNAKSIIDKKKLYIQTKQQLYNSEYKEYTPHYVTNALACRAYKVKQPFINDLLYEIQFELQQYGVETHITTNAIMYAYNSNNAANYTFVQHEDPNNITVDNQFNVRSAIVHNLLRICNPQNTKNITSLEPIIELPDILILQEKKNNYNHDESQQLPENLEIKDAHGNKKYRLVAKQLTLCDKELTEHEIAKLKIGKEWYIADGSRIYEENQAPKAEQNYQSFYETIDTSIITLYYDRYE